MKISQSIGKRRQSILCHCKERQRRRFAESLWDALQPLPRISQRRVCNRLVRQTNLQKVNVERETSQFCHALAKVRRQNSQFVVSQPQVCQLSKRHSEVFRKRGEGIIFEAAFAKIHQRVDGVRQLREAGLAYLQVQIEYMSVRSDNCAHKTDSDGMHLQHSQFGHCRKGQFRQRLQG